jgi:hypothetical protein
MFQNRYYCLIFAYASAVRLVDYKMSSTPAVLTGTSLTLHMLESCRWGKGVNVVVDDDFNMQANYILLLAFDIYLCLDSNQ